VQSDDTTPGSETRSSPIPRNLRKAAFAFVLCILLLPATQAAIVFNSSDAITFNVTQSQIGSLNGTSLDLNNNRLYDFFATTACSGYVRKINPDGTYQCGTDDTGSGAQNLSEVLAHGNVANQSIDMDAGDIASVAKITTSSGVAIGDSSTDADDVDEVAIGHGAVTSQADYEAIAIGYIANTSANNAIALGRNAHAEGIDAIAVGRDSQAANPNAFALGVQSSATADGAIAIGRNANAPNPHEATLGNLQGQELDVNVTGNLTVHGSNGVVIGNPDETNGVLSVGGQIDLNGSVDGNSNALTTISEIDAEVGRGPGDPSYKFTGDGDTGLYSDSADTVGLTAGSTSGVEVQNNGNVQIPNGDVILQDGAALQDTDITGTTSTILNITRETPTWQSDGGTGFTDITSGANLGSDLAGSCIGAGGGVILFPDLDQDGYLDLYMNTNDNDCYSDRVRENDRDNTFTDRGSAIDTESGRGAGVGDYLNDGDTDIIMRDNYGDGNGPQMANNTGSWSFDNLPITGNDPNDEAVMFHDIDGDGDLDVWANEDLNYLWYEQDDGADTFTGRNGFPDDSGGRTTGSLMTGNPEGKTAADITGNGYPDFLLWNRTHTKVLENDGDYSYTEVTDVDGTYGLPEDIGDHENNEWAWADYDDDGDMDVFISGEDEDNDGSETNGLFQNDGSGSFTDVTSSAGITLDSTGFDGAAWGDYSNDGHLDLLLQQCGAFDGATETCSNNNSKLYQNDGDGTFTDVTSTVGLDSGDVGKTVGLFDSDTDGDLDILSNSPPTLWRNDEDDNNYLRIYIHGNTSKTGGAARTPLGAQIYVYNRTGLHAHRTVPTSQNQLQPPLRQHIGVNPNSTYDISVWYPSSQTWTNKTDVLPSEQTSTIGGTTLEQTIEITETTNDDSTSLGGSTVHSDEITVGPDTDRGINVKAGSGESIEFHNGDTVAGTFTGSDLHMNGNDITNVGTLNASTKNFVQPINRTHTAVYTSQESADARAVIEGTDRTRNGRTAVSLPPHFTQVVSTDRPDLQIQITPYGPASLYVINTTTEQFWVERWQGQENVTFDYRVTGIRDGYEQKPVVQQRMDPGTGSATAASTGVHQEAGP
jgi:hypothetical protein